MRFAKGHGTGNDFVILLDPDGAEGLTAGLAARLCDRRTGIGGDGVLRVVRTAAYGLAGSSRPGDGRDGAPGSSSGADPAASRGAGGPEWFMDYRNADGSPAEMCGNGIRVFARYLVRHGLAAGPEFTVATRSGPRWIRMAANGDVSAEMGSVAVLGPGTAVIAGRAHRGLRVSVGNPHLACLVDAPLAAFDLSRPPGLDPGQFPEGANVELVRVTGPRSVAVRVHERGSGETRSCGTGAVAAAAAAAAAAAGGGDGDGAWDVGVPGGDLTVTLAAGRAWLTGPAVIVAEGELDPSWLAPLARDHGDMANPGGVGP
ncbi:MAG TPA: diaminopimelate epimerase [Streptosporangiaceae bacterium]|nr:diaminopimelate epimerase [Streptosporangiaceae bacterium]